MIAHVAEAGEGRGRVVLQVSLGRASPVALEAAIRVARAFNSEIESLFVEDTALFDIAGLPFARELSFSGRRSEALSPELIERRMRAAAAMISRELDALARSAEVPLRKTVVRSEPLEALATACSEHGPWNVVALSQPFSGPNNEFLQQLFGSVPGTTGLILVGPTAKRASGRIVGVIEDIEHFEPVLRTARRLFDASDESRFTLLFVADSEEEATLMDEQARLAIGRDEEVEIIRARIQPDQPAMIAEILRRLNPGFLVGRFGGIVVPPRGSLRALTSVLECPLFLIR